MPCHPTQNRQHLHLSEGRQGWPGSTAQHSTAQWRAMHLWAVLRRRGRPLAVQVGSRGIGAQVAAEHAVWACNNGSGCARAYAMSRRRQCLSGAQQQERRQRSRQAQSPPRAQGAKCKGSTRPPTQPLTHAGHHVEHGVPQQGAGHGVRLVQQPPQHALHKPLCACKRGLACMG